jgi:hypothetical protein
MGLGSRDLGYFVEAVEQASSLNDGFRLALVLFVPWAWQIIDGSVNYYGWVIQLWDGRRAYLAYSVDDAAPGVLRDISVLSIPVTEDTPG